MIFYVFISDGGAPVAWWVKGRPTDLAIPGLILA